MSLESISILAVDDDESFLSILTASLHDDGYVVANASDGIQAINLLQNRQFDLILLDVKMPKVDGIEVLRFIRDSAIDTEVIMLTGVNDLRLAVECMRLGAYNYITKPFNPSALMAVVEQAVERKRLMLENKILKSVLARQEMAADIIGNSKPMIDLLTVAAKVAPTGSAVLIQGSSGTGKELIAQFIHRNSGRTAAQFVALNCASIPENLIESELFGHERGAFTDAHQQKPGLVEIANGGTLFLDEIGEISLTIQPKLLRFLQTGEFRRVGGNKNLKADVRIISATNKNLREELVQKRFREDLMYRINVITLEIPPLRDRKEDIPLLVDHFLKRRLLGGEPRLIDARAVDLLMQYDWPGNVRELENIIERAAILSRDRTIRVEDLAISIGGRTGGTRGEGSSAESLLGTAVTMKKIERHHIDGVLKSVNWNKNVAAKILGISLKTLYTKIQQYNLVKP